MQSHNKQKIKLHTWVLASSRLTWQIIDIVLLLAHCRVLSLQQDQTLLSKSCEALAYKHETVVDAASFKSFGFMWRSFKLVVGAPMEE